MCNEYVCELVIPTVTIPKEIPPKAIDNHIDHNSSSDYDHDASARVIQHIQSIFSFPFIFCKDKEGSYEGLQSNEEPE